jgi:hypothetical protein
MLIDSAPLFIYPWTTFFDSILGKNEEQPNTNIVRSSVNGLCLDGEEDEDGCRSVIVNRIHCCELIEHHLENHITLASNCDFLEREHISSVFL